VQEVLAEGFGELNPAAVEQFAHIGQFHAEKIEEYKFLATKERRAGGEIRAAGFLKIVSPADHCGLAGAGN
jgi:hypothetical protein